MSGQTEGKLSLVHEVANDVKVPVVGFNSTVQEVVSGTGDALDHRPFVIEIPVFIVTGRDEKETKYWHENNNDAASPPPFIISNHECEEEGTSPTTVRSASKRCIAMTRLSLIRYRRCRLRGQWWSSLVSKARARRSWR